MLRFDDGAGTLREERNESTLPHVDLSRLLAALKRRKKAIIFSVIFWAILGVGVAMTSPRYYVATAQVLLDSNISRTLQQVSTVGDLPTSNAAMESARLVLSSDPVATAVADRLELDQNPAFMNPPVALSSKIIGQVMAWVRWPISYLRNMIAPEPEVPDAEVVQPTPEQIAEMQRSAIVQALQRQVRVSRVGNSAVLGISYTAYDPNLAADVVNSFANVYVSDVLNANYEATERMTSWMLDRLTTLEQDAREAAQAAEAYRAENGLVATNNVTMSQNAVTALNSDLSQAIAAAARARAQVTALEAVVGRGAGALIANGVPSGLPPIDDPEFQRIQRQLAALADDLREAERIAGVDSALYRTNQLRAHNAARQLFNTIQVRLEQARGEEALAEARVSALRESLNAAMSNDARSGSAHVELRALEDRATTLAALHQSFLAKFQELDQQKSFPISNVRVLNLAQVPRFAAGPSVKMALLVCIVLGLMTGLVIAAIREWRDRFLYTAEQVGDEVGSQFLGYLPIVTRKPDILTKNDSKKPAAANPETGAVPLDVTPPCYALEKPRSQFAETLRSIRLTISLAWRRERLQVIALSSARPHEGKTFIAYNLAATIAAGGSSVVLLDADPHRSGLSRYFGLRRGAGLLEVLEGSRHWRSVLRSVPGTGVDMLPVPAVRERPQVQEMLASQRFSELLAELRGSYDYIVLDLAPMGPVSDVRAVIDEIDGLVMLAEWGKTSKLLLRRLLHSDPRITQKTLGVALNKVNLKRLRNYASEGDSVSYLGDYGGYYVE
ncbi:Wzz/FepE/Etk N-terminal domain-containing protein [Salipiger abyssi]|uniref:Wzz/FepE/Etk N-terminal domain-containing protein n=1 Tax=Salipiger abyssi TaxID=1250539 RepID=UPI001A8D18D8|nr:Wzz/FepE/Etk N-terminal domain-containing protein [Salipiger abyssi]MBN9886277.1 chromosome partitioning protein ParA [Salipiger abyssi]